MAQDLRSFLEQVKRRRPTDFQVVTKPVDPATLMGLLPFPEVFAGERLRQHAPQLPLFVLAP